VNIQTVALDSLSPDPKNARKHNDRNIKAIAESLKQFGQRKPVVVYQGIILAGNGTVQAAQYLGWKNIDIAEVPSDWSDEQARAYALADNRSSELAEWHEEVLAETLIELQQQGWNIADLGFDAKYNTSEESGALDPYAEWNAMPEYETADKNSAFHTTIHFPTEADANEFFRLIERPKKSSMWYPSDDGHIGSSVKHQYVAE